MKELIEVYKMKELTVSTRCKIIIKLGKIINMKYSSNVTEGVVWELVNKLDPLNKIIKDDHYLNHVHE